jgi:hypothetical protein
MAKKKTSTLKEGTPVCVCDGVQMPEFPEVEISGWTGTVVEARGRGTDLKYFIEWDTATLQNMPGAYREHCESQGLYHGMVCLAGSDVAAIDGD